MAQEDHDDLKSKHADPVATPTRPQEYPPQSPPQVTIAWERMTITCSVVILGDVLRQIRRAQQSH